MSTKATVHDFSLQQFRQRHARQPVAPAGDEAPRAPHQQAATVFSDMADGVMALDYGLTFAAFGYQARQMVLSIAGLLGDAHSSVAMFDEELAKHLNCTDRTVRNWRSAYLRETQAKNFGFIEIIEGDYDREKQRYNPTSYRLPAEVKEYVNATVAEARGQAAYKVDRRGALAQASRNHYDEIPNAPPPRGRRKPSRSLEVIIEREFEIAAKHLALGERTLAEMPARGRAAYLASRQSTGLRAELEAMRAKIASLLEDFPQDVESEDVSRDTGKSFRYPNLSGIPPAAEVLAEPESFRDHTDPNTRKREAEFWAETEARLNAPQVRTVELEIVAETIAPAAAELSPEETPPASDNFSAELDSQEQSLPNSHICPSPAVDPEIIDERIFIMCESGDVSEAEAGEIARRDLCEACHVCAPESGQLEARRRCPT